MLIPDLATSSSTLPLIQLSTMPKSTGRKSIKGRRYKPYSKSKQGNSVSKQLNRYEPATIPMNFGKNIGFPQQIKVRMKYVDEFVLSSTAGSTATQTFRMNSIFDPDYTGVGHQPYGHDQWTPLYNKYTVLGSKLTATWSPITGTDTATVRGPWNVLTVGDEDGSLPGSILTTLEMPRCDHQILGNKDAGNNVKVTTLTFSPVRDLGLNPYDDTVGAVVGTNPSQVFFGSCQMNDINSTTSSVLCKVEMEFLVLLKGSKNQAQS